MPTARRRAWTWAAVALGGLLAWIPPDACWAQSRSAQAVPEAYYDLDAISRFYAQRSNLAAWTGNTDAARAALVQETLRDAGREGLDPADYHAVEMARAGNPIVARDPSRFELLLTDGLLRYAHDVRLGRIPPNAVDSDVELPVQAFDAVAGLQAALERGTLRQFLADLPPPHSEYGALREALARYQAIASLGPYPVISAHADRTADGRAHLGERLEMEDPSIDAERLKNDRAYLADTLKRFQYRYGLEPDGVLTARTLEALNVAISDRIAQIAANMERWRWLPRSLEATHIAVNVPDATLTFMRDGKPAMISRVVVGKPADRTPILAASVRAVTLNPDWDIPMSIARNEFLPALRRDPEYLARQHIIIVNGPEGDPSGRTIDWTKIKDFRYQLRQLPGDDNALGKIKLEMPNRFGVHLHDTPQRVAFARTDRDLSHGCMRVERIVDLASLALAIDPDTGLNAFVELIASGRTVETPLLAPLPVYVLYWTAFTGDDGGIAFRRDVYGRDMRLVAALQKRSLVAPSLAAHRQPAAVDAPARCLSVGAAP